MNRTTLRMKTKTIIMLVVGALLCAPAFTACQDDPEPVIDVPGDPGSGGIVSGYETEQSRDYQSWFDLPVEKKWGMKWMLGDDLTLRGPGEYEFSVPAGGEEFTFWFPDCNQILKWADFDGVVLLSGEYQLMSLYMLRSFDGYSCHGAKYRRVADNCVRIEVEPNGYSRGRTYTACFRNFEGGDIVRLVFRQEAGDGGADHTGTGQNLYWRSETEPLYHCRTVIKRTRDNYIRVWPDYGATEFAVQCWNADNLEIEPDESYPLKSATPTRAEYEGAVIETRGDSLIFRLDLNDTGNLRYAGFTVRSGEKSTYFCVCQRYEGSVDKGRFYPYDPEWVLLNDGTRWTGGGRDPGRSAIRVPANGGRYTIQTANYGCMVGWWIKVNGEYRPKRELVFWGNWSSFDWEPDDGGVVYRHHNDDTSKMDFEFSRNPTDEERVVEILVIYCLDPLSFVSSSGDGVFRFDNFLTSCEKFVFVQPPWRPGAPDNNP